MSFFWKILRRHLMQSCHLFPFSSLFSPLYHIYTPAPGDGALDPSREGPAGPPQPAGRTPGMAMCGACTSLALKAHLLPHSLGCRTPRLQEGSEQGYPERMAVRTRPARPVPTLIRCCHKVCAPGQVSGPRSPGTSPSPSLWFGRCALDTPPNARPVLP